MTQDDSHVHETETTATPPEPPAPLPLLTLSDGIPDVVDTPSRLEQAVDAIGSASGPIALDAERASGYRYSSRAYLIQVRRGDSGTWLIDPVAFGQQLPTLADAFGDEEWILHAATQDLPCLRECGLEPTTIFDTELAGRLLGMPRVGLATLVEEIVGRRMRKEHSAADWSTRPIPDSWSEYAALDVEVLDVLREHLIGELASAGKTEWAEQEFENLLGFQPTVRVDPWRRTSGLQKLRSRRSFAAVKFMWEMRDSIARERDVTPGRILPDSAIVAAATNIPTNRTALLATPGFNGRGADRYANRWVEALQSAAALDERDLPQRTLRGDGPPHPRTWVDKDPIADARYKAARDATLSIAEANTLPVENLITPDYVRRAMWTPPSVRDRTPLRDELSGQLAELGARQWQLDLTIDALTDAVLDAER